jgi:hypothetical protein
MADYVGAVVEVDATGRKGPDRHVDELAGRLLNTGHERGRLVALDPEGERRAIVNPRPRTDRPASCGGA